MANIFTSTEIKSSFEILQQHDIKYILLRNIDNELPDNLSRTKDIDILIHPLSLLSAHRVLTKSGWRQIRHPWNFGNNFIFLYSMAAFRMYAREGLHIDVACQLACRSPNQGEWMPLDQIIQDSAWAERRYEPDTIWKYRLGHEVETIHLITRCIFDKKQFHDGYRARIEELLLVLDMDKFRLLLELVFFFFFPVLEALLHSMQYDRVRHEYLKFSDY